LQAIWKFTWCGFFHVSNLALCCKLTLHLE
jgi:hypothetical protein